MKGGSFFITGFFSGIRVSELLIFLTYSKGEKQALLNPRFFMPATSRQ